MRIFLHELRSDLNPDSWNKPENDLFIKSPQGFTCAKFLEQIYMGRAEWPATRQPKLHTKHPC